MTSSVEHLQPQPLRVRILTALELEPMTVGQMSERLSAGVGHIRQVIAELQSLGVIQVVRKVRTRGRPWNVWGMAA